MAREIRLSGIGEHFEKQVKYTVRKATFVWKEKVVRATPVKSGTLRRSWDTDIEPFVGEVFSNIEYAEPVCYGTSLPPSWGGQFRTTPKNNTIKGFPELIGKQLEGFIEDEFRRM